MMIIYQIELLIIFVKQYLCFEKNCKKIIDEIIKSNIFIMDKEFLHLLNNIF